MKLINFSVNGLTRIGLLDSDHIVDLLAVNDASHFLSASDLNMLNNTINVISNWEHLHNLFKKGLDLSHEGPGRIPLNQVHLLPPMIPSTILCSGSNYLSHNQEKANADISGKEPEFFVKTGDCVIGPNQGIVYDPILTKKLDGEAELAVVIGKPGRHIEIKDSHKHIFGYTIVNDVTARDRQVRRRPDGSYWYELGRGKLFDTSAPLGPCITTSDEIPNPQDIIIRSWVNDELRQISSTSQMIWSVAELVHFFSINMTLRPGMVIITGTPSGTAWSSDEDLGGKWAGTNGMIKAKRYLQPNDTIVCEVEGIGKLSNPIII